MKKEFLICCAVNEWDPGEPVHEDRIRVARMHSYLTKCTFDEEEVKFEYIDPENRYIFKNSMVEGLCEFPNGVILDNFPDELIIMRDWKITNIIVDPASGNSRKMWLELLPNFHNDKCPYVIVSGNLTYNIVNLKTGTMHVLVPGTVPNWFGA